MNRKSSKGNQLKFEVDGTWYKADYLGYEGLAEYTVSQLLQYSSLRQNEYVLYEPEQIAYKKALFNGCKSRDFTDGWQLITLERLFQQVYGLGVNQIVYAIADHTERLKTLVELTERASGLSDFGIYMQKLLTVDAFFLNEDRHSHNIALMCNDRREFKLSPIFDNGAALLSDTTLDYPMRIDCLEQIHEAKSKTFCESFEEQMEIAETLYGANLRFTFGYAEVSRIVDQAAIYEKNVRQRVIDLVMERRRTHMDLFR